MNYLSPAERYEHNWKDYLDHTHDKLLQELETTKRDIILDASSGTGLLAKKILQRDMPFKELVLNDPDKKQQKLSKQRFQANPKIRHTTTNAENLTSINNYYTKIISLNAWHLYQDKQIVANTFKQILKEDGELHLLDWNNQGFFKLVNAIIQVTDSQPITTQSQSQIIETIPLTLIKKNQWRWKYWNLTYIQMKHE